MHPYWAGYRKPGSRQIPILFVSVLAGFVVAGTYLWCASPRLDQQAPAARRDIGPVVRHPPDERFWVVAVACVLFYGTIYAMGMALYGYFGDTGGYTVVSANAGQHMPLLFLLAGAGLAGVHGERVHSGRGRVVDCLMLGIGLGLLAIAFWGLYRAIVVNRDFYRRFYRSK
jgi:hypothetical protein